MDLSPVSSWPHRKRRTSPGLTRAFCPSPDLGMHFCLRAAKRGQGETPHVVALIYRVEHGDAVDYSRAEPLVREEPAFRLEVKEKQARFELREQYATVAEVRQAIQTCIDKWQFDAGLERGPEFFGLQFDTAEIKERNPTPGEMRLSVSQRASSLLCYSRRRRVPVFLASIGCLPHSRYEDDVPAVHGVSSRP